VANDPTCAALPNDEGILVAGILKSSAKPSDIIDPSKDEAIIWTILKPYERPLTIGGKDTARLVTGPSAANSIMTPNEQSIALRNEMVQRRQIVLCLRAFQ
jgi:hypothetical protein